MTRCAAAVVLALSVTVMPAVAGAEVAAELAFARGVIAYHEGDLEAAQAAFREALEHDGEHLRAAHYLGVSLISQGEYEAAVDVLEPAAGAHPDAPALRLELGVAYLLWGNLAFAARTLAAAAEELPDSGRARFFLGVALVRQGDCEPAGRHLEEAARLEPDLVPEASYLAGLCLAREGDLERARRRLQPLADSPVDAPVADAARRFVRLALRAEGIETALLSARASVSAQYDSNPTLAPNEGAERHDSVAPVFQLDATLRPVATERHTLAGRVAFYRSFYLPDEPAADYNYTHLAASAYYQLRGELGGVQHQLQLGYDFALGLFDGPPPLADENHLYSELHGGRVLWTVRESADLQTRLALLVQHRRYAVRRRNNTGLTVGLGQTVAVPVAGLQLYLEGTIRIEEAHSLEYDVVAPGALLSVTWSAPWELLVSGFVLYEHEAHPASSEGRADEQINLSVAVQRQIIDHLGLSLVWMHTENISTVARFDYRRDVLSLSIWGEL